MKKTALYTISLLLLFSCKKEQTAVAPPETGNQLLTKITRTTHFTGGTVLYDEVTNFKYNVAGKIIAEGDKTYERDAQQRIVRILNPRTSTNRTDIRVFYSSPTSNQVAYTLCNIPVAENYRDSVVYQHDASGRLIRTTSYISEYSKSDSPDTTYLSLHYDLTYDASGNIAAFDYYNAYQGTMKHCSHDSYENYDSKPNPQYTDDEVRIMDVLCDRVIIASKNNVRSTNGYTYAYTYRADGRPRNGTVKQNGNVVFTLAFAYN
jgi:hypothetical protein